MASTPTKKSSFEIAKHDDDPLHTEDRNQHHDEDDSRTEPDDNDDDDIEVESLLFFSKKRRRSLDELARLSENKDEGNLCNHNAYCCSPRQGLCMLFLIAVVGVVTWAAMTQDLGSFSFPSPSKHKLPDMCRAVFNTSVDELLDQVGNMTKKKQRCYGTGSCKCESTMEPHIQTWDGSMFTRWNKTFHRNKEILMEAIDPPIEVVFYGDSITEHWWGTDLAVKWQHWLEIRGVFDKYFNKTEGASYNGIPLGIGGDRVGQLLYRIENGELPDALEPKVFWILIGTNDLGADKCSAEVVAAGNIRVAQELQKRRSKAKIVLNSLLPRGAAHLGDDLTSSKEWHEVQKANQWLKCYADSTHDVEFFNATSHFVVSYDKVVHQVETYFHDGVHPSKNGSKSWAKGIVKRLNEMIPQ